jgi:hypothetical protein
MPSSTISNPSSPFEDVSPASASDALDAEYTIGCDLGRNFDPTAIAIIRKINAGSAKPIFQCGHLERLPLQTTYPAQVAHIGRLLARLRGPCELVVDSTGVGKAVADMFQAAGLATINVTITAGDQTTNVGLDYHVPKIALVSRLQALLHNDQLKIHRGLADAQVLVEELQNFHASVSDSGFFRFGARGSSKHDDLVLALAIAAWRAHGDTCFAGWGMYEFYRQQYGNGAEPEQQQQPQPPKPEEDPFPYGFNGRADAPADVVLKAPGHVSAATGLSGKAYLPDARGLFTVTAEDAKPLLANGWTRAAGQPA